MNQCFSVFQVWLWLFQNGQVCPAALIMNCLRLLLILFSGEKASCLGKCFGEDVVLFKSFLFERVKPNHIMVRAGESAFPPSEGLWLTWYGACYWSLWILQCGGNDELLCQVQSKVRFLCCELVRSLNFSGWRFAGVSADRVEVTDRFGTVMWIHYCCKHSRAIWLACREQNLSHW